MDIAKEIERLQEESEEDAVARPIQYHGETRDRDRLRATLSILTELNGKIEELFTGCNEHFNDRETHLHKPTTPEELPLCPFCGKLNNVVVSIIHGAEGKIYRCGCNHCRIHTTNFITRQGAVDSWSHRYNG